MNVLFFETVLMRSLIAFMRVTNTEASFLYGPWTLRTATSSTACDPRVLRCNREVVSEVIAWHQMASVLLVGYSLLDDLLLGVLKVNSVKNTAFHTGTTHAAVVRIGRVQFALYDKTDIHQY
jgi:hypothetical protein